MADLDPCLAFCLREEGGYVHDSADPGGATNRGITLATLSDWRGHPCTVQDVHDLSLAETKAVYQSRYWNAVRGDDLPAGVDLMVFDMAVNAGVARSAKMLQAAVAVIPDGHVGPATLEAVGKRSPFLLVAALAEAQEAFYRSLPTFATFGHGWLNRVAARRLTAVGLMQTPPATPAPAPAPVPVPARPTGLGAFLAAILSLFARKGA